MATMSSVDAAAFIIQFMDNVKELSGGPKRAFLKELIGHEKIEGTVSYIGGAFKPNLTAGAVTNLADRKNRYTFDNVSPNTSAAVFATHMLTRNDVGVFQRTQIQAVEIAIGMWKDIAEKEFLALGDITSKELKNLMQGYWTKEDLQILNAIFAATTTRVVGTAATPTTTSSVSMPASQVLPDYTYANLDHKIFSEVSERMQNQYVTGEKICLGFSPTAWKALVQNSGTILQNQDYVRDARHFESGDLPEYCGITPVVHPLFGNSTLLGSLLAEGEVGLIAAWTMDGMCWGEAMAQKTLMKIDSPEFNGQSVASIKQIGNAVRIDDLQVITGAILEQ